MAFLKDMAALAALFGFSAAVLIWMDVATRLV
jgi:hypothetical protein